MKVLPALTRISGTRHQATATRAAFIEESRMKFVNANKLDRKSGGRTWRRISLPKWYWTMPPFEETVGP